MTSDTLRAGILGAGFISEFHLKAIAKQKNVKLVAVCDLNIHAARKLTEGTTGVSVFTDLDIMIEQAQLNVIHILTQPDSHFFLAKKAIESGCDVIIEKPVTINSEEAESLAILAKKHKRSIAINHNFVFSRPFNSLKRVLDQRGLGPIKSVRVVWKKMLPQMNSGPWDLWMLRKPGNILFETGSHTISELLAVILDAPSISRVSARLPKVLPTGSMFYRRWSISAESGATAIEIDIAFDQGYGQHFIEVEGMFGVARADVENDVFTLDRPTGRTYDIERFFVNFNGGLSRVKQAFYTYGSYAISKFLTSAKGSPYDASMLMGITNCYDELRGYATRRESSINYAISIAKSVEAIQAAMPVPIESEEKELPAIPRLHSPKNIAPKVLIVGASGFIGKRLLTRLIEEGRPVRALVRNISNLVGVDLGENSEIIVGDFRNETTIEKALHGIDVVFHLAVAHSNSLQGYLRADSEPTLRFARMCEKHGVRRFIYTGTIDSLHLAKPGKIKETDGVDKQIKRRNNYAHSKAITESKLCQMYQESKFPVVIVRPAIVLGTGGPVNHVGIANWFGPGRCAYWGDGKNLLPIVLVDDVVSGLIAAIDTQGIEGKTYNLSAESCISARDYVSEVEKVLGSTITASSSSASSHFVGDFVKWGIKVLARHPDSSRMPSLHDWKCREQHAEFDTSLARVDLGWRPINDREIIIEKGIREPSRLFLNS